VRQHDQAQAAEQSMPRGGQNPEQAPGQQPGHPEPPADRQGGTIRQRLARILALPVVVVLLLLGVVAAGEVNDYRTSTATSRSVDLALAVQDLVQELQTERGLTAGLLGGNEGFRNEIRPSRVRVDRQRAAVTRLVSGDGEVEKRVRGALSELDGLPTVRAATDAATAGRAATFAFFTERIATLTQVDFGFDRTADPELRRGVATLEALGDIKEATAQERAFLNGVFSAGGFARGEFVQFAEMRAAKEAALARFGRFATPGQRAANAYVFDTGAARIVAHFERVAADAADGRPVVVNPQSWWSALTTVLDDMQRMQQHVGSQIRIRAHEQQNDATRRIGILLAVVLLCFAGSIYLATLASLSITRPLAALAAEADSAAAVRLPEAVRRAQAGDADDPPEPPPPVRVPARATEEIRSVAGALDRVQAAAYKLATEQAMLRRNTTESLANLGRRNQNLLRRQLGFITTLEREEIDPSGLANLFELDHLATRMRRNAESLLVLVGASSPRQWSSPVPVADVIRAAVSEVEEYRRVSLRRVDEGFVAGAVVGGIAHLLAELIENGLTFSPPDSDVEIQGRRVRDGYLVAITDQGVGMTPEELEQANARLRGEGDFIAAPARFLGHYVVGQLARQMAIDVELLRSPVTGITARVTLPMSALATPSSLDQAGLAPGAVTTPRHARGQEPARLASTQIALSQSGTPALAIGAPARPERPERYGRAEEPSGEPPAAAVTDAPAAAGDRAGDGPADEPVAGAVAGAPSRGARPDDYGSETERTRNGLRKRTPRERRPQTVPAGDRPRQAGAPDAGGRVTAVDDSPAEVRARLTALRAGLQRGQQGEPRTQTGTSGQRTSVEPGERPE
jgi:hypothetical protein